MSRQGMATVHRDGWRFASPAQARESVLARYVRSGRAEQVRTCELRVAAGDRACAIASGVYEQERAFKRQVVAAVASQDVAVLEQLARSRRAATARARAVVSRPR